MSRHTGTLFGLTLAAALAAPARADFVPTDFTPIAPGAGYFEGVDAGVGPGEAAVNSLAAADQFRAQVGPATTTVDFGPAFAGLQPTANGVASAAVEGLRVTTEGISYNTPPPHYQYGLTSSSDPVANSAHLGYSIGGTSHYEYVPVVGAGTASLTIHSDVAFGSFGFYVTGLGNLGGVVKVALDGKIIPGLTLTGSPDGGALFLGYVGATAVHDLSIVMPDVYGPSRDVFGLSGVEFVAVPEPSALVLTGLGLAGSAVVLAPRRRQRSRV